MTGYIGNRSGLPTDPDWGYLKGPPAKLRVFSNAKDEWWVDGCAVIDGVFFYTEDLWVFETWQEAIASLPSFWEEVT